MSLIEKIDRVERIHQMIQYKRTGSPSQFARKLGVSQSRLYQMLKELKQLGAPIAYCKYRQSYLYLHPVRFRFGFEENTLSEKEAVSIGGGGEVYMVTWLVPGDRWRHMEIDGDTWRHPGTCRPNAWVKQ